MLYKMMYVSIAIGAAINGEQKPTILVMTRESKIQKTIQHGVVVHNVPPKICPPGRFALVYNVPPDILH